MKSLPLGASRLAQLQLPTDLANALHRALASALRALSIAIVMTASAAALSSTAEATTIIAPTIDEMTIEADAVIVGTVRSVDVERAGNRIIRLATVEVSDVWKAECAHAVTCPTPGSTMVIQALGGRDSEQATRVFGSESYVIGEEVLVFLQYSASPDERDIGITVWQSQVLAWTKFSLVSDESSEVRAVRDIEGITPIARKDGGDYEVLEVPAINEFPLHELRRAVDAALAADEGNE